MSQTESGVAEQMVGMSIRAMESLSRLLATGAKNLAVFLFTIARSQKQYRGITSVKALLDGGHELKTLELDKKELHEFCRHAKKHDIPCTVVHDKRLYQDKVPVLIRAVDAERVNRVVELMRLSQPAREQSTEREAVNPTTERTNLRSQTRPRFRPSAQRSDARGNIASISPSRLRPSVRANMQRLQRERRGQQPQIVQPRPAQTPAWNMQDERMMEAMRQLLFALTTITQELTKQPVHETSVPAQTAPAQTSPERTTTVRSAREQLPEAGLQNPASEPARAAPQRENSFRSQRQDRQSVRKSIEKAKGARSSAQPAPSQPTRPRSAGRGGR